MAKGVLRVRRGDVACSTTARLLLAVLLLAGASGARRLQAPASQGSLEPRSSSRSRRLLDQGPVTSAEEALRGLVIAGLDYCTDAVGEGWVTGMEVDGLIDKLRASGPSPPLHIVGGGTWADHTVVEIDLTGELLDEIVALVVPEGDHGNAVRSCFVHAVARADSDAPDTGIAQAVLLAAVGHCAGEPIEGLAATASLKAAMRTPPSEVVNQGRLKQQVFGENGTTFEALFPQQVFSMLPAILQIEGPEADFVVDCTRGVVRGGDDYQQGVWGAASPFAVVLMQTAFWVCSPRDVTTAFQRNGRFVRELTDFTADDPLDRMFGESYGYTDSYGGISLSTGGLDPSASLIFRLAIKDDFLRRAAAAMEVSSQLGIRSADEFYGCMQAVFGDPDQVQQEAHRLFVALMVRLNDLCSAANYDLRVLQQLSAALDGHEIGYTATKLSNESWEFGFEVPLSGLLDGTEALFSNYRTGGLMYPEVFTIERLQMCFVNLLEGKFLNNVPQFDKSMTALALKECQAPTELGRTAASEIDYTLQKWGGHSWSNISGGANGTVTTWSSVPDQLPSMLYDALGVDSPELETCMEEYIAKPATSDATSLSVLPIAAMAVLQEAAEGCSSPSSVQETVSWANNAMQNLTHADAVFQNITAGPDGIRVTLAISDAVIQGMAQYIADLEPGRATEEIAACLALHISGTFVTELATTPPAAPSPPFLPPPPPKDPHAESLRWVAIGISLCAIAIIFIIGLLLILRRKHSQPSDSDTNPIRDLCHVPMVSVGKNDSSDPNTCIDASQSSWLLIGSSRPKVTGIAASMQSPFLMQAVTSAGNKPAAIPDSVEIAILAFVYRLHFARACLGSLYAIIVEKRSINHSKPPRRSTQSDAQTSSMLDSLSSASDGSEALDEEKLREATSLQLRNALLMKSLEDQGADFNIDFAKDIKPYLRGKLGEGAYGAVYRGQWKGLPVAVKVMHAGTFQGHEASRKLQSFAKEVSIMSGYRQSENLLRLHGACLRRPHVAIVYELMAGNLGDRIYSPLQEPMELLEALHVARAVAGGLDELHPDVVHRDLKPQNILLTADGQAKIADFGLSRSVVNPLDSTHTSAGTPLYMSPEAFDGQWTTHGDIWAFGVVLNECLTRKKPFAELDLAQTFQVVYKVAIQYHHPEVAADAPEMVQNLILDCWNPDPLKRPSIKQVLARIDTAIELEEGRIRKNKPAEQGDDRDAAHLSFGGALKSRTLTAAASFGSRRVLSLYCRAASAKTTHSVPGSPLTEPKHSGLRGVASAAAAEQS